MAAAALVVFAGIGKLAHPQPAHIAMQNAGIPSSNMLVTVLALAEMAVGISVLVWASRPAIALLGLFYVGFALFVLRLRRSEGANGSCGCFGAADTPPHVVHTVINATVAMVVFWGVFTPPSPITSIADEGIATMFAVGCAIAALSAALYAGLTKLPQALHRVGAELPTRDDAGTVGAYRSTPAQIHGVHADA